VREKDETAQSFRFQPPLKVGQNRMRVTRDVSANVDIHECMIRWAERRCEL
jgi:hypothetical protein